MSSNNIIDVNVIKLLFRSLNSKNKKVEIIDTNAIANVVFQNDFFDISKL
jgi:hypothetical protein